MSSPLATISTSAVTQATLAAFTEMYPRLKAEVIERLFRDVESMFSGRYLDYAKIDTPYHDFQHTLQVTLCLVEMLLGRHRAGVEPLISPRQFELGIAAALLHDTGYLKLKSDSEGTGAKYTFTHVLRSCAVASSYLPTQGVTLDELDGVLGAIRCTNPSTNIRKLYFQHPTEGIIGCAVATADYLGQMSAPDYLEQLPLIYAEFEESDDFAGVAREHRRRGRRAVRRPSAPRPGQARRGRTCPRTGASPPGTSR